MEKALYGRSCDNCRNKKVKCSRTMPNCSRCLKTAIPCTRNNPIKKRGPKPQAISKSQPVNVYSGMRVVSQNFYNEQLTNHRPILNLYDKSDSPDKFKFKETTKQLQTSTLKEDNATEELNCIKKESTILDLSTEIKAEKEVEKV